MIRSAIDSKLPEGRFDRYLNILEGNQAIYKLLDSQVYNSLYHMIDESDHGFLRLAINYCLDSHCELAFLASLHAGDGICQRYLFTLRPMPEGDYLYITLSPEKDEMTEAPVEQYALQMSKDLFSLMGSILMYYLPSQNLIRIFWLNNEQEIDLYHMSLDTWLSEVETQKRVAENDLDTFRSFCTFLGQPKGKRTFLFHSSILSDPNRFEPYSVTLCSRTYKGEPCVIGYWNILNESGIHTNTYTEENYLDSLTQLLNKHSITEYAQHIFNSSSRTVFSLLIIDIDNFKHINDNYGHLFGDQVIQTVADTIKKTIGSQGTAGRFGGDEFMIVLKDNGSEQELRNFLRTIKTNVKLLFSDRLGYAGITCSVGAASGKVTDNYIDLFQLADKCLYIAKQKGKNRYVIYTPELHGFLSGSASDMAAIKENFYSHKTLHQINLLLKELILQGCSVLPGLLALEAQTLLIDRLHVFWGKDFSVLSANQLYYTDTQYPELLRDPNYLSLFDDDLMTITNTNLIEYPNPQAYAFFKKHSIYCTMQHILRDREGNICGLITADQCQRVYSFPMLAIQLFGSLCTNINAVLLRDKPL